MRRSAEQMRTLADAHFSGPGSAYQRISGYLRRERNVLRGCRIGRLTQDPDIVASPTLRQPVQETFEWLRRRLADVLAEGTARGEFRPTLDPAGTAAAIAAVLQGGYVLARAAGSIEPFNQAIDGILALLASQADDDATHPA